MPGLRHRHVPDYRQKVTILCEKSSSGALFVYSPKRKSFGNIGKMPEIPEIVQAPPVLKKGLKAKFAAAKAWIKAHPKKTALIGVTLLALAGFAGWKLWPRKMAEVVQVVKKKPPPKPTTKPSPLTGIEVAPELADRTVRAMVIENHPDARPQSGLSQAGVVYEALAEGGITRYLAFFGDEQPKEMGPIRSLRPYFVSWGLEFDAPVAHVGGSAAALSLANQLGMKDMNQFYNGGSFYRISSRYAPHNVYTTPELIDKLIARLGFAKVPAFKQSPRKKETPPASGINPAHPTINIRYSYADYNVRFGYDRSNNNYLRFLAGIADKDANSRQQISVKNVVVEYMPTSYDSTGHALMQTVGSGKTLVFRDGGVVEGTWSKPAHGERTKLLDAAGKDIPLNRGHTWYCIVAPTGAVTY